MRRRLSLAAAVVGLAVVAAVLVAYRVSLEPLGLHPREVQFAVAKAEALVDTPVSQLVDRRADFYLPLTPQVAVTDALYLKTDGVLEQAAAAAGIPGQEISASGPFTLMLGQSNLPSTTPSASSNSRINKNYRLLVDVDGATSIISLYAQAPTERAAFAIVNTVRAQLVAQDARQELRYPLPAATRVVVRPLGAPTGGIVDPGAKTQLMAFVFCLTLLVGVALVRSVERRRRRPRRVAPVATSDRLHDELPGDDDWPHTKRILPWSMALFMAMIFLVPIDQMSLPVHLPLASTPDRLLLICIGGVWIAALAVGRGAARPRVRFTGVHFVVFLLVAVAFLGVAVNGQGLATYQEVGPTFKKLFLLVSFVLFFVIACSAIRPGEVPRLITLMIGLGVIVAIAAIVESKTHYNVFYSLWQKVAPVSLPSQIDQLDSIGRLTVDGPTSEPLELAALLSMVIPFAFIRAVDATTRRQRILNVAAGTILLAGAIATQRKTSVVAPVCGMLVLIAYRPRILRSLLKASIPLFVAIHIVAPGQIGSVIGQLLPGHAGQVATTADRVARYDAVRPDVMSHLLLGRGFQSYDPIKYRILDNEYLGLLIGVGAIGLALYLLLFGCILRGAHPIVRGRNRRRAEAALPAMAAIVIVVVSNALFDVLSFPHVSYLFFLVAAMLIVLRQPVAADFPVASIHSPTGERHARPRERAVTGRPATPAAGQKVEQPLTA